MAFTEDLSVFFNTGDFAVAATFTHTGGSPMTVNVIFDAAYADPLGIEGTHPRAHGVESDFPSVAHGDTLVINAVTYDIVEIRPDGTGVVTFTLSEH